MLLISDFENALKYLEHKTQYDFSFEVNGISVIRHNSDTYLKLEISIRDTDTIILLHKNGLLENQSLYNTKVNVYLSKHEVREKCRKLRALEEQKKVEKSL